MNRRACEVRVEDNHNRECSYSGDVVNGIVVHSAKFRCTVFLRGQKAKNFVRRWFSANSQEARNHVAESYFIGV